MYDTGLAERIRRKAVEVVEIAGWQTRGSLIYNPKGSVNHHTAGPAKGATPSLATCIYGRGGENPVPGPLCQVLQSREPVVQDKAYVIAAGRANHAGTGSWRGLTGNSSVGGLEVEHTGTGRVSIERLEVAARIQAALLEAPGSSWDAAFCCQHFEWTTRKIDFYDLWPWDVHYFRQRVGYWIGRDADTEEDEMALDQDYWDRHSNLVDGRLKDPENLDVITDAVLKKIGEEGFGPEGSGKPIRKALLEMARRGPSQVLLGTDPTTEGFETVDLRELIREELRTVMRQILGDSAVPDGGV